MHSLPQRARNLLDLRLHTVPARASLDEEIPSTRPAGNEGEAQKVEGLRLSKPAPLAIGRRKAAELNQAGFVRMQRQRKLLQPFAHRVPEPSGVTLVLESD